jgi:peptidoglycan/xylan/chitin deacetylase (PgdA/CDA1 family)
MRKYFYLSLIIGYVLTTGAFAQTKKTDYTPLKRKEFQNKTFIKCLYKEDAYISKRNEISKQFEHASPGRWGIFVHGVDEDLVTSRKIIAFTFDACGGPHRNKYDKELIEYLRREKVPATLFVTGLWIDDNYATFLDLSKDPLFEIENHGFNHQPCSINGESKYGIKGTPNGACAFDEIEANEQKIQTITGRRPIFYRSATAYIDEAGARIASLLGVQVISFDVLSGDAVPYEKTSVIKENVLKNVKPGAIIIMHFNHPEWNTCEALKQIIPELKKQGYSFSLLKDYPLVSKTKKVSLQEKEKLEKAEKEKQEKNKAEKQEKPEKIDSYLIPGKLPEWSIGTVSKTVVRETVPRVRIPHFPL